MREKRLPFWLKKNIGLQNDSVHALKVSLRSRNLHTVCEEAKCPNIFECFKKPTATFIIMGNICTRNCGFCSVDKGIPSPLYAYEPLNIALAAKEMGLKHLVITSVTRDDLQDGGASFFSEVVSAVKDLNPEITIEILTPDFNGEIKAIDAVCQSPFDVFNHNLETVKRLYPVVRPQADYERSLFVLSKAAKLRPDAKIKSGIMVGLGERKGEVIELLNDLFKAKCNYVTIGQYLKPGKDNLEVYEYVEPEIFDKYKRIAEELGFEKVFSAPFVRSSFHAEEMLKNKIK